VPIMFSVFFLNCGKMGKTMTRCSPGTFFSFSQAVPPL
jgi:hypothetical protein